MKVWVPIDLPDNFIVDYVVVRGGKDGVTVVKLCPVAPLRGFYEEPAKPLGSAIRGGPYSPEAQRERSEPQRERWEYRVVVPPTLSPTVEEAEKMIASLGLEGWEAFAVSGMSYAVWLKRRML